MKFHESKRFSEEGKQKVAFVDIDETICFYSGTRRYDLSEPNYENIEKINDRSMIFTALRSMNLMEML